MTTSQRPTIRSKIWIRRQLGLARGDKLPTPALLVHVTDQATGEAFIEVAFATEAGEWKSVRVPKEVLRHHPAKLRDILSKFDAILPREPTALDKVMKNLSRSDAPNWWQMAPTLGWQSEGMAFALHDQLIGERQSGQSKTEPKLVPPDRNGNANMAALGKNGDLAAWKSSVAAATQRSSAVTLALCVSFAAPLLSIAEWPTFMVVLFGPGKAGKSTAALAGATVLGIGQEKDLPNWNLTSAALAEVAQCYNDLPLVLNGLESTKLRDKELRDFLKSVTYILGDGIETRRHSSWSVANGAPATWRTIALVTSEQSFDEIASRANDTRMDGERARAINVAAIAPDDNTIIDWFSKDAPEGQPDRDLWARKQVETLRVACGQQHGTALKPYLEYLIRQDKAKLRDQIRAAQSDFVAAVKDLITSEALNHAAKNFGMVYAGGLLAVDAELVPLTQERLLRRLKRCFERSIQPSWCEPRPLANALRLFSRGLQRAIAGIGTPEFEDLLAMSSPTSADHAVEFVVHSTKLFNQMFDGDEIARVSVLRWLWDKGLLEVSDRAEALRAGFTIASVRHTRRIKGKNCATIVFRDPRAELKAALK